jgi:hypothetical protein
MWHIIANFQERRFLGQICLFAPNFLERISEAKLVRQHTSPKSGSFYRSPNIPNEVNSGVELLVQSFHIMNFDLAVLGGSLDLHMRTGVFLHGVCVADRPYFARLIFDKHRLLVAFLDTAPIARRIYHRAALQVADTALPRAGEGCPVRENQHQK